MSSLDPIPPSYREEMGAFDQGEKLTRQSICSIIIALLLVMPQIIIWENTPVDQPPGAGPSAGMMALQMVVAVCVTAALAVYYPYHGFWQSALIAGPVMSVLAPAGIMFYLQFRTESVYLVEVIIVCALAATPGIALYVGLTWLQAKKLGWEW